MGAHAAVPLRRPPRSCAVVHGRLWLPAGVAADGRGATWAGRRFLWRGHRDRVRRFWRDHEVTRPRSRSEDRRHLMDGRGNGRGRGIWNPARLGGGLVDERRRPLGPLVREGEESDVMTGWSELPRILLNLAVAF